MEHTWTYIFQELKLVGSQRKAYSTEETIELTQTANSEVFLPKAKSLGGKIVKNQSSRNLICFDQLKNAEEYLTQIGSLLKEFKSEKSNFHFETTTYIWTQSVNKLNAENMLVLKEISNLLKNKNGNYCSQKLNLKSYKFGKIIIETKNLYLCELVPHQLKNKVKKTKMLSLRILIIILISGLFALISKRFLSQLNTKIDLARYDKVRLSLESSKPQITFHLLKNINVKENDRILDEILFDYIQQEWSIFLDLPKGSSPKILKDRIELLIKIFPWSHNLIFFAELLDLLLEFDQSEISIQDVESILHNSSLANENKVIILTSFCVRYDINPFFLSSKLKSLNLQNNSKLYLSYFEACLKNDIKGKELEFLKWFETSPELEIKKHLELWINDSVPLLAKNSFTLLIMMQQIDPNLAQNYIQKKISENSLPLEEVQMLPLIKDIPSREILAAYLEELIHNLDRRKLHPKLQSTAESVLNQITG